MTKSKYLIFIIISYLFFSLIVFSYYMVPTKGKKIDSYDNPQKALLIIDIQKDLVGEGVPPEDRYNNEKEIIKNTNTLIDWAIENNYKVIHSYQEFSGFIGTIWSKLFLKGKLLKGHNGTLLSDQLKQENTVKFSKPKGDAFANKTFEEFLIQNKVNEVLIVGIDGQFCVYHTSLGAINRGYKVSLVKDAIGIKNQKKKNTILNKYETSKISILETTEIIQNN